MSRASRMIRPASTASRPGSSLCEPRQTDWEAPSAAVQVSVIEEPSITLHSVIGLRGIEPRSGLSGSTAAANARNCSGEKAFTWSRPVNRPRPSAKVVAL